MTLRSFRHNYHDSHLAGFTLGPRRELILDIALSPVWNKDACSASVRFGGIKNYDEIVSFFRGLPAAPRADAYIAEIFGLEFEGNAPNEVFVDLEHLDHISVHAQHVDER